MKRFHVHVAVDDLTRSIRFYSALFAAEPTVRKQDYAKWQLDDPRVNFAISTRGKKAGVDHLGIQAEDGAELEELRVRLAQADVSVQARKGVTCCYAKGDKYWTLDPQGIAWESFHTLDAVPVYGESTKPEAKREEAEATAKACCSPST